MTDQIITKKDAIDRMRDGLPCETCWPAQHPTMWMNTRWQDFEGVGTTFRKPPEPRREARTFWVTANGLAITYQQWPSDVQVREVLPDEVAVRRMTEAEVKAITMPLRTVYGWTYLTDAAVAFAGTLGLLKKDALVEQQTTGHCPNNRAKGGCQLHNLQCGYPDCDRKPKS